MTCEKRKALPYDSDKPAREKETFALKTCDIFAKGKRSKEK